MRRHAMVGVLALAAVLGACASDSVTSPTTPASMPGTWNLVSIDGAALPVIIAQVGSDNFQIVDDVITADSTGHFTELTTVQSLMNGQMATDTIADSGSWSVSGTSVALVFSSDGSTAIGTIAGSTLALSDPSGGAMIYSKQ